MGKKTKIKLDKGTVYQKEEGGIYYYRYQVNGERKCVSLKTANQEDAIKEAKKYLPIVQATNTEVISAHVKVARNLVKQTQKLRLCDAFAVYEKHPNRATPATRHEEISYGTTFQEFIQFAGPAKLMSDITPEIAEAFSAYLKTTGISVSTHNRKIVRVRRIFTTLKDYYQAENPFASPLLRRKPREEQGSTVRRLAFTKEQEETIRNILNDNDFKIKNKNEIKVIYYIGMYTGQRLKDCVLLQWQNVDFENNRISVKQFKTGKDVVIPIAAPLLQVLREALSWKKDGYVSPEEAKRYMKKDANGKVIGDNYVNSDIMRVINKAGFERNMAVPGRKRKMTVYGFHSLRHSFATFCANAGIPKAVVVSILGADSEIIDHFYTHVGEEAQIRALEAVTGETHFSHESESKRIQQVLDFIDGFAEPSPEIIRIKQLLTKN